MLESFKGNAFEYKRLTEEEQQKRKILGRLTGVIADTKKPTRNGRAYSDKLWENVFNNDIMQEKIKNRCVLGELGHPADRTEIDIEKVAICLAEVPKKGSDGKIYGVFDILDTPNGRLLKTLCDYGTIIGVSSRGQGDLIQDYDGNDSVDPDTYECECWDAVLLPAVLEARMTYVKEGLDLRSLKLKKALNESVSSASDEDRKIMKETLNNLHFLGMNEAKEKEAEEEVIDDEEAEEEVIDDEEAEEESVEDAEEENIEDTEDVDTEEADSENIEDEFAEFDDAIEFNDEESETPELDLDSVLTYIENNFGDEAAKKVEDILLEIEPEESEEEPAEEDEESEDAEDETDDAEEDTEEADEEEEKANDDGDDSVVESLKKALKEKAELEKAIKSLQEKLAVSDTKVDNLNEECDRYKNAITRLSSLAKNAKTLKEQVDSLNESLAQKEDQIKQQQLRISRLAETRKKAVNESIESAKKVDEVKALTEELAKAKKSLTETKEAQKKQFEGEIAKLNENLTKVTSIKESYKKLANKAVNKYIEVKAITLGLTSTDIKRKLGESYSIEDVDAVCEELKAYNLNVSKLPFNVGGPVRVKVNESNQRSLVSNKTADDDEVDSTLIKLANL